MAPRSRSDEAPVPAGEGAEEGSELLALLVRELRTQVVRHGLPVRVPKVRSPLFELHCVTAHSVSDDLLDRRAALDGILRRILAHS